MNTKERPVIKPAEDGIITDKAARYREIGNLIDGHYGSIREMQRQCRIECLVDEILMPILNLVESEYDMDDRNCGRKISRPHLKQRVTEFVNETVADYIAARKGFLAELEAMLPGVTVVERDDDIVGRVVAVVPQGPAKLSEDQ